MIFKPKMADLPKTAGSNKSAFKRPLMLAVTLQFALLLVVGATFNFFTPNAAFAKSATPQNSSQSPSDCHRSNVGYTTYGDDSASISRIVGVNNELQNLNNPSTPFPVYIYLMYCDKYHSYFGRFIMHIPANSLVGNGKCVLMSNSVNDETGFGDSLSNTGCNLNTQLYQTRDYNVVVDTRLVQYNSSASKWAACWIPNDNYSNTQNNTNTLLPAVAPQCARQQGFDSLLAPTPTPAPTPLPIDPSVIPPPTGTLN